MSRNWAIAIGINHYDYLPDLDCAVSDAEAMRVWFESAGFEKVYLFSDRSEPIADGAEPFSSQPTFTKLRWFLRNRFENPCLRAGDNFWFFFSGHGIRYGQRDYLLASDSDPNDPEGTAIAFEEVSDRLRECGADNLVLLLDACRNEMPAKDVGIGEEIHQGVVTISSCSPAARSYEIRELGRGAFTYALLESLQIEGEGNCATVERLCARLKWRLPEVSQQYGYPKQVPYPKVEPASKYHLILLPKKANVSDVQPLKVEALNAEVNQDYDRAEKLWIRVLAVWADPEAIAGIKRIAKQALTVQTIFYQQQIETLQQQINELERQSEERNRASAEQHQQVSQLEQRLAALETEKQALQQRDLEKDGRHQQQINELKQQLEQERSHLKALNSQYEQLQQEKETPQPQPPKLESDRGVDYTRLHNLLVEGKWQEADQETASVMLKAAKREGNYLRVEDIDNFPCTDLRTIDRLWVYHSGGRFGFSVQSAIYRRHGGTKAYNPEVWRKLAGEAGWQVDGSPLDYSQLNFSLQAVAGHLPCRAAVRVKGGWQVWFFSSLAQRLEECSTVNS